MRTLPHCSAPMDYNRIASSISMTGISSLIGYLRRQASQMRPSSASVKWISPLHFGHANMSSNSLLMLMSLPPMDNIWESPGVECPHNLILVGCPNKRKIPYIQGLGNLIRDCVRPFTVGKTLAGAPVVPPSKRAASDNSLQFQQPSKTSWSRPRRYVRCDCWVSRLMKGRPNIGW